MPGKYKVSPPEERRAMGRTFGSRAEMRYALYLENAFEEGFVVDYICQPRIWLGVPENVYVPDFFVVPECSQEYPGSVLPHYIDVKGMRTAKFNRDVKLFKEYGRSKLIIVKESSARKFKTEEIITPKLYTGDL